MIYFVQMGLNGPIKIGQTKEINRRIQHLQNGNPYKLFLLATLPGGKEEERIWLTKCRKFKIKGEWIKPSFHVLDEILKLPSRKVVKIYEENFHKSHSYQLTTILFDDLIDKLEKIGERK